MADEKAKKGMTDEEIIKTIEENDGSITKEIIGIMRSGEYLSPLETDGVDFPEISKDEIYFCHASPITKALWTINKREANSRKPNFSLMKKTWEAFLPSIKADPMLRRALETLDVAGAAVRKGWKIVLLPPLTEEEKMEQIHREIGAMLEKSFGGMGSRFAASPFEHGSFSYGASPFKDIFESEVHIVCMGEDLMEEGPFKEDSSGIDHPFGIFGRFFNRQR